MANKTDLSELPENNQPYEGDGLIAPITSAETPSTIPPPDVNQTGNGNGIEVSGYPPPDSFPNNVGGASNFPLAGSPPMGEGVPNGVFSVPRCGSRVWVFFHGGDIQKPVYFAYSLAPTDHQNFYGNPPPQPDDQKESLPVKVQPPNQSGTQKIVENPLPTKVPETTQTPTQATVPEIPLDNSSFIQNGVFNEIPSSFGPI